MVAAQIVPFDSDSPYFLPAVRVYMQVFQQANEASSRQFVEKYAAYPDWHGRVALHDGKVIGIAFGARALSGNWWYERVARRVGRDHPALHEAWVLIELGVLADYRNQGIGGQLHDIVVAAQPYRRLLLSTQVSNHGARRFYERRDWDYLHPGFVFAGGQEPYVVMHKTLD